jgi:DNA excision repair protein ERCC-4
MQRMVKGFNIITDSREKLGYSFNCVKPKPKTIRATLKTGDYSIQGMESLVTVERKSLSDAWQTFVKGRKRFERELQRMSEMEYAVVIIEADWTTIFTNPPKYSKVQPKTIYASIMAWQQRFKVHFWCCPGRDFAERTTYRILERFYRDKQTAKGKRSHKKAHARASSNCRAKKNKS